MCKRAFSILLIAAAALSGCSDEYVAPSLDVKPPHERAATIRARAVTGNLAGKPFEAHDARFALDRRQGYEKITIYISQAKASEPCGKLGPKDAPKVWLRRAGLKPVKKGEIRLTAGKEAPWQLHYQHKEGHHWLGSGLASALVVFENVSAHVIKGAVAVCFADGKKSCVDGSFSARHCPIRIDATMRGNEPVETVPQKKKKKATPPVSDAGTPAADAGKASEKKD